MREGHSVTIAEPQVAHETQGPEVVNALLTDPWGEHHG